MASRGLRHISATTLLWAGRKRIGSLPRCVPKGWSPLFAWLRNLRTKSTTRRLTPFLTACGSRSNGGSALDHPSPNRLTVVLDKGRSRLPERGFIFQTTARILSLREDLFWLGAKWK